MAEETREYVSEAGFTVKYRCLNRQEFQRAMPIATVPKQDELSLRERVELQTMKVELARELGKEVIVDPADPREVVKLLERDWDLYDVVGALALNWASERKNAQKK